MKKEAKDGTLFILIVIALSQGPILYFGVEGFFKLILTIGFGLVGLILSCFLLFDLIIHRSTTKTYHVAGLCFTILLGLFTIRGDLMEFLDFNLRKSARNEIVDRVKRGEIKSEHISANSVFALSQGGEINIKDNAKGIVSIEFYIDQGFIDHYSAFLYTNNPDEIQNLESRNPNYHTVKKLDKNWYRVDY